MTRMPAFAVLGGSGVTDLPGFELALEHAVETPYGTPSAPIVEARRDTETVLFLPRHGPGRAIAPHDINYRANLWALKARGARRVVAVSSVGGITARMQPGTLAITDQIIDYTWGRAHTFFESDTDVEIAAEDMHVDFTEPFDPVLRQALVCAADACGVDVVPSGCYGATQGPRLESAAEIARLERDGCDVVGMTGMPEAALAREAGLAYAQIAVVANRAPGKGADKLSVPEIIALTKAAVPSVAAILAALVEAS